MVQTTLKAQSGKAEESISVPIGIIKLVRTLFRRCRFNELFDGMKEGDIPMSPVVENLCIACLKENYSMNDWDDYVRRNPLRKEYYCGKYTIRRWSYQRCLERLGINLEEVVDHIAKVTRVMYPDMPTHCYVDGSHIKRNGPKGAGTAYGEGGGTIQLQNQFMFASNVCTGIPITIESYPGNFNDPQQYRDFVPQLLYLLKTGSLVIMDNGGATASVINSILDHSDHYLTRVRTNDSDVATIDRDLEKMTYVGMGVGCIMHTFQSSGRTTYMYFSIDSYIASLGKAQKTLEKKEEDRLKAQSVLKNDDPMAVIKLPKSDYYVVEVQGAKLVMTKDPWMEIDPEKELKDAVPAKAGWFKLECSFPMDPRLALVAYRHRVDIEHLISSLKSVVNMDPLRVWNGDSIRGKLALGLITQFMLSVAIYDMEPSMEWKVIDGKSVKVPVKPSPETVVKELRRYRATVTRMDWGGYSINEQLDEGVIDALVDVLNRYAAEGPISIPDDLQWMTPPPAQWGRQEKNCKNLGMSIAQSLEKTIFSGYMEGRSRWWTAKIPFIGSEERSNGADPGSKDASESVDEPSVRGQDLHPAPKNR